MIELLRLPGLVLAAGILTFVQFVEARQPERIPRIAILSNVRTGGPRLAIDGLRQGLRDLGYIEGKNIMLGAAAREGIGALVVMGRLYGVHGRAIEQFSARNRVPVFFDFDRVAEKVFRPARLCTGLD